MTDHRLLLVRRTPGEQRAYRQGFEAGRAWKHDSDPFDVPVGGGEPQPTTLTESDVASAQEGIAAAKCIVPVVIESIEHPIPGARDTARSAGGGDQPDTPCPQDRP